MFYGPELPALRVAFFFFLFFNVVGRRVRSEEGTLQEFTITLLYFYIGAIVEEPNLCCVQGQAIKMSVKLCHNCAPNVLRLNCKSPNNIIFILLLTYIYSQEFCPY